MKRLLIIGASHGIGLEAVKRALEQGYFVRAFARSADKIALEHDHLEKFVGDALSLADVTEALDGIDVVIMCLGVSVSEMFHPVSLFSEATRILLRARENVAFRRLLVVTGFGAGESRKSINFLQKLPFEAIFARAYDDKSLQEELVRVSDTDWTIARPGILTNGPRSGKYQVLTEPHQWHNGLISRADVADFLVKQVEDDVLIGKAPVLVY